MPGRKKYRSIASNRIDVYKALKRQGKSKRVAAKIANAGKTKAGRKAMARKAAATRRRKKRRRRRR